MTTRVQENKSYKLGFVLCRRVGKNIYSLRVRCEINILSIKLRGARW